MKKAISTIMILMMVFFTLTSFADGNTTPDSIKASPESQRVKELEAQLGDLNLQLINLVSKLIALTGSDSLELDAVPTSMKTIIAPDSREDDHEEGDDEEDDEEDDDDDADGVSGATSTVPAVVPTLSPLQIEANALRLEIITLMKKIESVKAELELAMKAENAVEHGDSVQAEVSHLKRLTLDSIIMKGITFHFDVPPVIKNGRTLVPVRGLTEGLGAKVSWDQQTQKVTIAYQGKTILLQLGKQTALVNGKTVALDAPVEILDSRVLVPVRFIAESLGLSVVWHPENESIVLAKKTVTPAVTPATTTTKPTTTTTTPTTTTPPADTVSGATPK